METRAIVILYCGNEPSEQVVTNVVREISHCAEGPHVDVRCLNSEDIAKTFVASYKVGHEANDNEDYNNEELALIYLGEKTKEWVKNPFSSFTTQLAAYTVELKLSGADYKFLNALRVLGTKTNPNSYIRKELRKKYLFLRDHVEAFAEIGKHV